MGKNNKIHRLKSEVQLKSGRRNPIIYMCIILTVFIIVVLALFKDTFKFSSIDTFTESNELLYSEKIVNDYNTLSLNVDYANVYIKESASENIEVSIYGDSAKSSVNAGSDKTLNIKSTLTCLVCHNVPAGKIVINIPKTKLKNIKIKSTYGDITISNFPDVKAVVNYEYGNFSALSLKSLNLNLKSGNVKLEEVDDLVTRVNIGNVTANYINNYADIDSNLGNIIISEINAKKESNIYTEVGSLTIIDPKEGYYKATSKHGDITLPSDMNKNGVVINVGTDTGNIVVGY